MLRQPLPFARPPRCQVQSEAMAARAALDPNRLLGREPERLTLEEREKLAGKWIALEIYTPRTLPLRRIEAVGDTVEDCVRQLAGRGLDPRQFEFEALRWPY